MARFTIDGDKEFDRKLEQLAKRKSTSKANVVRNALAMYFFMNAELEQGTDRKLVVTDNSNHPIKEIVLT